MPKDYHPVSVPPDDLSPEGEDVFKSGLGSRRRREMDHIRDQTLQDAAETYGMQIKGAAASAAETTVSKVAASNIGETVSHLEDVREQEYGNWGQKIVNGGIEELAKDHVRRQRGIAEGVGHEVAKVARRPITPPDKEPGFLEKLRGEGKKGSS